MAYMPEPHGDGALVATDLLTDSAMVCSETVELGSLSVAGIRIGSAADQIPRKWIVKVTFSPMDRIYRTGQQFFDEVGKQLSLSQAIDSVIHVDGTVHVPHGASFKIVNGIVVGFGQCGPALRRRFLHLKSYVDFVAAFGIGDRVVQVEAHGDLFGFDHYYFRLHKMARWSVLWQMLEVVNWGVYDRDASENMSRTMTTQAVEPVDWNNNEANLPLPVKIAAETPRAPIGESTDSCCGQALQESDYGYGPGHWWTVCPRCGDTQVYGLLTAE